MKVIVITSPRTMSNWYTNQLAIQHDIINYKEQLTDILHKKKSLRLLNNLVNDYINKDSGVFNLKLCYWLESSDWVNKEQQLRELLLSADKIIYLYRKNKEAQIKSLLCAEHTSNWFDGVMQDETINISLTRKQYNFYEERYTKYMEQLIDCQSEFPGVTQYSENIILGNEQPYKQLYNVDIT